VNFERVEKIAEAVLYEGYMLYPYRPSSVKNQQRWNFGVLCPPAWCEHEQGSEASAMQTECLVRCNAATRLTVKIRFLQLVERSIGRLRTPGEEKPEGVAPEYDLCDRLDVGGRVYLPLQEAAEREQVWTGLDPATQLLAQPLTFAGGQQFEYVRNERGDAVAVIVRAWEALHAAVEIAAHPCRDGIVRITVRLSNRTPFLALASSIREAALPSSLVSAHTILGVEQGEFLSVLDPPAGLESLAARCHNIGTWPVLVGEQGETMLSSPIILYDHPQIAPESAGNLFDSTEIDEILSLRILTLTEEEKREIREGDDRARQILERTENMPEEQFMKLHGVLRGLAPVREVAP
jgi:hydrogenase maturation protease